MKILSIIMIVLCNSFVRDVYSFSCKHRDNHIVLRKFVIRLLSDSRLNSDLPTEINPHIIQPNQFNREYYTADLINRKKKSFEERSTCEFCFLSKSICLCERVKSLAGKPTRTKLSVIMHFKEWGKPSNTGKLIKLLNSDSTDLQIFGLKEAEEFKNNIQRNNTVILFPGKNSISISEYLAEKKNTLDSLHLCTIDSTWSQAKSINSWLPDEIPRVNVNNLINKRSMFLNRKQTVFTKVSTLEATLYALQQLGEEDACFYPPNTEKTDESNNAYLQALMLSVDSVNKQAGRPNIYGSNIEINYDLTNNSKGPFQKSIQEKPVECIYCNQTQSRFKNMGISKMKSGIPCVSVDSKSDQMYCRYWKCKICGKVFGAQI